MEAGLPRQAAMNRIVVAFFALVVATPLAAQMPLQVRVPFVGPPLPSRVVLNCDPGRVTRLNEPR
jgi:hypothetical protein